MVVRPARAAERRRTRPRPPAGSTRTSRGSRARGARRAPARRVTAMRDDADDTAGAGPSRIIASTSDRKAAETLKRLLLEAEGLADDGEGQQQREQARRLPVRARTDAAAMAEPRRRRLAATSRRSFAVTAPGNRQYLGPLGLRNCASRARDASGGVARILRCRPSARISHRFGSPAFGRLLSVHAELVRRLRRARRARAARLRRDAGSDGDDRAVHRGAVPAGVPRARAHGARGPARAAAVLPAIYLVEALVFAALRCSRTRFSLAPVLLLALVDGVARCSRRAASRAAR